jgi:transcriptional regulator
MTRSCMANRKKEMIQLRKEGKSLTEIAAEVGLSKRQVSFSLNDEQPDPDRSYRTAWNQMKVKEQVPAGYFDVYERLNWLV